MKALIFRGPGRLSWEAAPDPVPGEGEAVVRVKAVGICGSDLSGYTGANSRRTPGLAMGHEAAGQVVALGQSVPPDWLGRRVALLPMFPCGSCDQCRGGYPHRCQNRRYLGNNTMGAMAQRIALPAGNLYPLPEGVSYPHGSLAEPLAVAVHAVHQAGDLTGCRVLIAGAGPIGLLTLVAALAAGAGAVVITNRGRARRDAAVALGATAALDPSVEGWADRVAEAMGSGEVDVAFDAGGIGPTFQQALEAVRPGGTVVAIGAWASVPLDLQRLVPREIHLVGSFNFTPAEFGQAVNWLGEGRFDPSLLVTGERPMAEGAAVFQGLTGHRTEGIKTVLVS